MPYRTDRSKAPHSRRWWSSARLRIVLGISLTTLIVFAVVALIVFQLLRLTEQRETNQLIERKVEDFISYVESGAGELASSGSDPGYGHGAELCPNRLEAEGERRSPERGRWRGRRAAEAPGWTPPSRNSM